MHRINVPEVEQLDGVGVWVTATCAGGLTVAAILTECTSRGHFLK